MGQRYPAFFLPPASCHLPPESYHHNSTEDFFSCAFAFTRFGSRSRLYLKSAAHSIRLQHAYGHQKHCIFLLRLAFPYAPIIPYLEHPKNGREVHFGSDCRWRGFLGWGRSGRSCGPTRGKHRVNSMQGGDGYGMPGLPRWHRRQCLGVLGSHHMSALPRQTYGSRRRPA